MYAKEIKLAEKLIRKKQERDGILLLMKTLVQFNDSETYIKKEYQTAGQLFASLLPVKHYRLIIFEFTKEISQTSVIYLTRQHAFSCQNKFLSGNRKYSNRFNCNIYFRRD